jgi:hypothetical protein
VRRPTCCSKAGSTANAIRVYGYYADDYRKVDGWWRFAHRKLVEIMPSVGF